MAPAEHVLFVGAGLSAAFGYALTSEILPRIVERSGNRELFGRALEEEALKLRPEFDELLEKFLPGLLTAPPSELPSVTDVLSLIDHLLLADQSASPEMMVNDLHRLRELIELAICELVSLSVDAKREHESVEVLDRLADWIVNTGSTGAPVTIITTNYDFVLEEAIGRRLRFLGHDIERAIDYGFTWRSTERGELRHRPADAVVRFIRLHGAVNWLRCRMCRFTYINPWGPIFHQSIRAVTDGGNTCHCHAPRLQSVIVAPSIVRTMDDVDLQTAWKAALEELRLAQSWVLLGYSLPNEDVAIRSIFIRAMRGRRVAPVVRVFEKNPSLEPRFRLLFRDAAFSAAGVEDFVMHLPVEWPSSSSMS